MNLNYEQTLASTASMGYNLIIASAGTGKTSTIVGRIKFLLEQGIDPSEILLLTFTNKASKEMINRISSIFSSNIASKINAGTFHSISYTYLKHNYHRQIALKSPRDLKTLLKGIHERYAHNKDGFYSHMFLYDSYSLYKNKALNTSFGEFLKDNQPRNSKQEDEYFDMYEYIFNEFDEVKEANGYVDFNDLLILFAKEMKLLKDSGISLYKEVLCDEYQDTNPLQNTIIKALNPSSLFCVGDYDQSIYAFNGADINIITSFKDSYKDSKVFNLSKNYRSNDKILALASKVISKNPRIYQKPPFEGIKVSSFYPSLLTYSKPSQQYLDIASRIKELYKSGVEYENIAIIFRNNLSSNGFEANLRDALIPCKIKGASSFFELKEIDFIISLCTTLIHPKDMISFIHIFSHAKGLGSSASKDLFLAFLELSDSLSVIKGLLRPKKLNPYKAKSHIPSFGLFEELEIGVISRYDEFLRYIKSHPIFYNEKLTKEHALFFEKLFKLYESLESYKNPSNILNKIYKSEFFKGFKEDLIFQRSRLKDGSIDEFLRQKAINSIDTRLDILENLSRSYSDLLGFLNNIVLNSGDATQGDGVNLLSVHASKGLEFECVFVVDLMQGRFPNEKLSSKNGSIEEERRLFYVAITRAKDRLFLSYCKYDSNNKECKHSIFLEDGGLI